MPAKRAPKKPSPPTPEPFDRAGRDRMRTFAGQRRANETRMRSLQRDPMSARGTAGRNTLNKMAAYEGSRSAMANSMGAGSSEMDMARRAGGMSRAAGRPTGRGGSGGTTAGIRARSGAGKGSGGKGRAVKKAASMNKAGRMR